ncbi:GxxExxY protein [Verrucomicrobia bacterium S94]|nr:GxxExxY protein [Verrucomicrobia bacterium S94]
MAHSVMRNRSENGMQKEEKTYAMIGACMEVHRILGCGFLEAVYQDALEKEFILRGIPFEREMELPVFYKGELLNTPYRVDFYCYDEIPLELKALSGLSGKEESQIINYLKASDAKVGLLVNFGKSQLEYKRFVN